MNKCILFSIVIPTYNVSNVIENALISIKNQTYSNYEVIIIDDFSCDYENLINVISKCKIRNLRIVRCSKNSGGPALPRNIGINMAKGDWICFLDADDYWYCRKLETIKNEIKSSKFDLIYHSEIHINKYGKKFPVIYESLSSINQYKQLLEGGNKISTSAVTVSTRFLKMHNLKFDEDSKYTIVEDYDLWLRIAEKSGILYRTKEVLGVYVMSESGISSNQLKQSLNLKNLLYKHIFKIQKYEKHKFILVLKILPKIYLSIIKKYIKYKIVK